MKRVGIFAFSAATAACFPLRRGLRVPGMRQRWLIKGRAVAAAPHRIGFPRHLVYVKNPNLVFTGYAA